MTPPPAGWSGFLARPRGMLVAGLCLSLLLPACFAVMLWFDLRHDNDLAAERATVAEQAVQRHLGERLLRLGHRLQVVSLRADMRAAGTTLADVPGDWANAELAQIVLLPAGGGAAGHDVEGRPATAPWLPPAQPATRPAGLAIGAPIRIGGQSRWWVPVAWYGDPGRRVGALVAADWFAEVLADYPLGDGSVLDIIHVDGILVARSKGNQTETGVLREHARVFAATFARNASGRFDATSPVDHVRRQFVYARMAHAPLVIVAGVTKAQIFAAWWPLAVGSFAGALVFSGLWLWLNLRFARSHAAQGRLVAELRRQTERGEEARRIAHLGDWTWHVDDGRVFWSPEVYAIWGLPVREGPLPIDEIPLHVHADDRQRLDAHLGAAMADGAITGEVEFRILRASDGAVRTIYSRAEWIERTPGRRVLRGIQQDVTELAQARERQGEAERQYRYLFEHNPLPMWVYDCDSLAFIAVNDAMLAAYGYAREELLQTNVLAIRPGEEHDALRAAARGDADARQQGSVWTHLRRDGSRLRAEVYARRTRFEGRDAWLVMALDVTERERHQQRFQLIARATSDAIWDWDAATGATWRSDSFFSLFGYQRADIAPDQAAWAERVHPDDRERAIASVARSLLDGSEIWEERYRFACKDGRWADVLDRCILLRDERGRVVRAVGGMLDITQRNRDEQSLRLLRRAVEATDNGIVIADARDAALPTVYANRAFRRMLGQGDGDGGDIGFHLLDATVDADTHEVAALRHAIAERREIRVLLRGRRKDGQPFWTEVHLAPVRDETGTVSHFVSIHTDVTDRQRAQEQLAFHATHDELTGLPNRSLLVDRLQQALLNAERHHRSIAVLFIDLDDFKLINDSLGHSAGDDALRQVAVRLLDAVDAADTVARFGGDEFVVMLCEQVDDTSVQQAIMRLHAALATPLAIADTSHYLGASIGWCRSPDAGSDAEVLLMRAELAMYKAKQGGRNRAIAYEQAFASQVSARLRLVGELRVALEQSQFEVFFQPLFGPAGTPTALEALVRWRHPERGLLLPDRFIGMCEESGLVVPLGRWVLREAARHHRLLAQAGLGGLRIAVNVSALHFQQDLFADVQAAMREYSLPAGVLELELTESVIMGNPDSAIDVMRRLDDLGVALSVDDFGTGYSSLSYLKRLPIDRLKIDRSFVRDLGEDADDAAICATIIALARSLGLRTVAEGVETQAQHDWLRERGCDELQGFLLGQPLPFAQVLAELGRAATPSP